MLGCEEGTVAKHSLLNFPFQRMGGLEGKGPAEAGQPAEAGNLV